MVSHLTLQVPDLQKRSWFSKDSPCGIKECFDERQLFDWIVSNFNETSPLFRAKNQLFEAKIQGTNALKRVLKQVKTSGKLVVNESKPAFKEGILEGQGDDTEYLIVKVQS